MLKEKSFQNKKMLQIICILIGRLLLLCFASYELLHRLYQRLHALISRSYDYWQCDHNKRNLHELFTRVTDELQKLPQHLVIVLAPDADSYVDAALLKHIFLYAQIVGIPYVSVYDRRKPGKGYVDLTDFCQSTGNNRCYLWPPGAKKDPKFSQNGDCSKANGYAASHNGTHYAQLQVYQIGRTDGHALIADVCRELYENRTTPEVQELLQAKQRQVRTDAISERLNKRLGFAVPEPELGIIFSEQTCTYGLLPWHIRFTEFHMHQSGRYFDAKSFASVLYKYARCEQRWGK